MLLPGHDSIWDSVFADKIPPEARQPASVDVRLGDRYIWNGREYDAARRGLEIEAGQFLLACTRETVRIPADWAGRIEGKSSWARRGLMVHTTAGFLDPGFSGVVTLELLNVSSEGISIVPGDYIAQISLHRMWYPVEDEHLYRGKYQGAQGPQSAKNER